MNFVNNANFNVHYSNIFNYIVDSSQVSEFTRPRMKTMISIIKKKSLQT